MYQWKSRIICELSGIYMYLIVHLWKNIHCLFLGIVLIFHSFSVVKYKLTSVVLVYQEDVLERKFIKYYKHVYMYYSVYKAKNRDYIKGMWHLISRFVLYAPLYVCFTILYDNLFHDITSNILLRRLTFKGSKQCLKKMLKTVKPRVPMFRCNITSGFILHENNTI